MPWLVRADQRMQQITQTLCTIQNHNESNQLSEPPASSVARVQSAAGNLTCGRAAVGHMVKEDVKMEGYAYSKHNIIQHRETGLVNNKVTQIYTGGKTPCSTFSEGSQDKYDRGRLIKICENINKLESKHIHKNKDTITNKSSQA